MQPTLKQLQYFQALAEQQHFGRAAALCHVTQSSLSASIRELETSLQAMLVDRTTRQVRLTPLGQEVARRGQEILRDVAALTELARSRAEPLSGILRLGVIPTIGPFLLPDLMPRLRRAYPRLKLYLREDLTDRLLAALDSGQLDLVLMALPYATGSRQVMVVAEDNFYFCCAKQHRLAGTEALSLTQLRHETWLLLADGHCLRDHALEACRLRNNSQENDFTATSLYTLVQMVANNLGVTLVPKLAVDAGLTKNLPLIVRPLAGKISARQLGLVWRKSGLPHTEAQLFGQAIKNLVANQ